MREHGGGIHLTREIRLPFTPFNGLQVCGRQIDTAPGPEGFVLKDVIWDVDREVFLGHVEMVSHDLPIAEIPADLKSWTDLGWRMGSYADKYESSDGQETDDAVEESKAGNEKDEWESMLQHPTLSPRQRPKELNLVMRAMIRTMVEENNDLTTAYAMDKTKRFFSKDQLEKNESKPAQQWNAAIREYIDMDWQQQWGWREAVMRTHPPAG